MFQFQSRQVFAIVCFAGLVSFGTMSLGQSEEKPSVKQIMKDAFKGDLLRKVGTGQASDQEKAKLLSYAKIMGEASPPKGDADSWATKTKAFIEAAQAAVDGKEDAPALLKKSTNCKACHGPHKP